MSFLCKSVSMKFLCELCHGMETNDWWREKPRIDYGVLFCVELNGHTSVADFGIASRSFCNRSPFFEKAEKSYYQLFMQCDKPLW